MSNDRIDIPNLINVIDHIGADILADIVEDIRNKNKVASSKLLNSLRKDIKLAVTSIILQLEYEDYGLFVDQGRRSGAKMPPVKKIKEWCKVRGISERAAYPIAKKIHLFGIPPVNFVRDVINRRMNQANDKITEAAKKDLQIKIDLLTKEIK